MADRPTLHLTGPERALWDKLPAGVTKGWTVETEMRTFVDTEQRLRIRLGLVRLKNPALKKFQEKASAAKDAKAVQAVLEEFDVSILSTDDLEQLVYGLGPAMLSAMIERALTEAEESDAVEFAAALIVLRHQQLKTFTAAYTG